MSAYITVNSVKTKFPDIASALAKGSISTAQVSGWIDSAENWINGKIGQRYELPFSSNPPLIVSLAYEFFEYFWQKDIHTPTSTGDEVPWIFPRYDRLMKMLQEIVDGTVSLIDTDGEIIQPSATKLDTMRSNHRDVNQIFTMGDSWEQSVDDNYSTEPD